MKRKQKSLVLLSGGIDSYVALALEKQMKFNCTSLSFVYDGQPEQELRSIQEISKREIVPNYLVKHPQIIGEKNLIERIFNFAPDNLLYYSIAIAFARNNGMGRIVGGQNKDDLSDVADANNKFYNNLNNIVSNAYPNLDIELVQPLINMTKLEVVEKGLELNLPLDSTWSCQSKGHNPCGICSSCITRYEIAEKLNIKL